MMDSSEVAWTRVWTGYIYDNESEDFDALAQDKFVNNMTTIQAQHISAEKQLIELWKSHEEHKNIDNSGMRILFEKEIISPMEEDEDRWRIWLGNLMVFLTRSEHPKNIDNFRMKEKIGSDQHTIGSTEYMLGSHAYIPGYLDYLGTSFQNRFEQCSKAEDIDQAILSLQQAIDPPNICADKPLYLGNLGKLYQKRFEWFGRVADINRAIFFKWLSVILVPDDHAEKPSHLSNLGNSLHRRFQYLGIEDDINLAISVQQQAIKLTQDGHADKPIYLNNLGTSFLCRFKQFGQIADVDQAVLSNQQAVDLTPEDDASKPDRLINFGNSLQCRFKRFGKVADIEQAILMQQQAVELTPHDHVDRPSRLNNLGISFQRRFERLGKITDIDKAIRFKQESVNLTPDYHATKPGRLSNLGNSFQKRFERLREAKDINQAILLQNQAVDLTPKNHASKPGRLINLGNSLHRRFEHLGNIVDIDQAIDFKQLAVDLTPYNNANRPGRLSNLGNSLQKRFERLRKVADIDKAILIQQEAVNLTPDGHADKPSRLNNLGISFQHRFKHLNKLEDICQAALEQQKAVDLTPNGHAEKTSRWQNLGHSLSIQFSHTSDINHLQSAISAYSESASSLTGSPRVRLESAREWALLSLKSSLPNSDPGSKYSSLQACHVLMELVPRVVWFGNSISLRYHDIASIGNFVNIAVSIACSVGSLKLAFEWLEQGRSIVWGQILRLRTPIDDLKRDYPELAIQMESLSSTIELVSAGNNGKRSAPLVTDSLNYTYTSPSLEEAAQDHRRLAEEWEDLLLQVRRCPGYKDFLQPKKFEELSLAAKSGPIVCVNVDESRCDALILQKTDHDYQLEHVHLRQASLNSVKTVYGFFSRYSGSDGFRTQNLDLGHLKPKNKNISESANDRSSHPVYPHEGIAEALEILWNTIVEPVAQKLGYKSSSSSDIKHTLPHVTWCTTGLLAFLPLHAAGHYHSNNHSSETTNDRAFNYIVSSYTPSISALMKPKDADPHVFQGLTAVSLPFTADHAMSPLSGTRDEVAKIKDQFSESDFTWLDGLASTKANVLERMKKASWLHLACHGVQRKDNPMESAFELYDGPLSLYTISQQNLPNARLAFLSACQTAAGDENIPSEAAHLAAGMLMIGYHSVIGTMWSIDDQDAPIVSEEFYKYLFARKMKTDDGEAAYALHEAVGNLREKIGEKEFARWIPFIHLGI